MIEEELHWYALKVFYNRVFEIEDQLSRSGMETYIPVRKTELKGMDFLRAKKRLATKDDDRNDIRYIQAGPRIYRRDPVVASLLFVRCSGNDILKVREKFLGYAMVYYTADRTRPSIIPEKQMAMFRMVTSKCEEGLEFFSDESIVNYRQGDKVRVKEGPLKGAEGYIKRIKKDRRLLVAIEGFVAVATSFIPPVFLEKVEETEAGNTL